MSGAPLRAFTGVDDPRTTSRSPSAAAYAPRECNRDFSSSSTGRHRHLRGTSMAAPRATTPKRVDRTPQPWNAITDTAMGILQRTMAHLRIATFARVRETSTSIHLPMGVLNAQLSVTTIHGDTNNLGGFPGTHQCVRILRRRGASQRQNENSKDPRPSSQHHVPTHRQGARIHALYVLPPRPHTIHSRPRLLLLPHRIISSLRGEREGLP